MRLTNYFLVLVVCLTPIVLHSQEFKVMSYNIKYDNKQDTVNNWNDRKEHMVALLNHYGPSFVGMQEVLINQLEYLDAELPSHKYIGVGRDDGKQKGEFSPILYDANNYTLLQSNTFWLSESPEKISVGWDASMERICTYGLFEDKKTKEKLWVFNTHFDHRGKKAREESAKLILNRIKDINTSSSPIVLMGDFNLMPDSNAIQSLKRALVDGLEATEKDFYGPTGTFNSFDQNMVLNRRIDYIFVKNLQVKSYLHIDDRIENNKHISDHLPVLAKLSWQ